MNLLRILLLGVIAAAPAVGTETDIAAAAINALGLDLHRQIAAPGGNTCLSPYSIQVGLALAYAGADGATRTEMARVLRYPADEAAMQTSLIALIDAFTAMQIQPDEQDESTESLILQTANRLFGQQGFEFRPAFVALLRQRYHAPLEVVDLARDPELAAARINDWVTAQTRGRIPDVVPPGALGPDTRLVLVNALYFKASWAHPFEFSATRPLPFHVSGGAPIPVPTLQQQHHLGYRRWDGFSAVALPYIRGRLQFLVLVPDPIDGLAALEAQLTPKMLRECAEMPVRDVVLYLPKFKLEPPAMPLAAALERLGMTTAFDQPRGSADFDRMAPRRPDGYPYLSEVLHKTFIAVDESGTEAAAATAVFMATFGVSAERPPPPVVVRVDRPFFYAIQDVASGACLFLGRVVDPR